MNPLQTPGLAQILQALPHARLVGGCVRDHLAGRPSTDIDLATPDPPEQVIEALTAAHLRAIPTGLAHGTVTALASGHTFEITTLRRDLETDGRHATIAFTNDWKEDAARRDFTINAMSMTPDGTIFDYFNGTQDLHAGRVRFVGDAATRIAEDYLRILRFFRFHARYATGAPDAEATQAIAAATQGLHRLSAERIWSELRRILQAPTPDAAIALMHELGVLQTLLPQARTRPLNDLPADPILRLAALHPTSPAPLNLSNEEATRLEALQGEPPPENPDDATLRRLLADTPAETLIGRAWLAGRPHALRDRLATTPTPVFPLQGRDLAKAGMPPGPHMGQELKRLRTLWLDSGCTTPRAALLAQLAPKAAP